MCAWRAYMQLCEQLSTLGSCLGACAAEQRCHDCTCVSAQPHESQAHEAEHMVRVHIQLQSHWCRPHIFKVCMMAAAVTLCVSSGCWCSGVVGNFTPRRYISLATSHSVSVRPCVLHIACCLHAYHMRCCAWHCFSVLVCHIGICTAGEHGLCELEKRVKAAELKAAVLAADPDSTQLLAVCLHS